jgi:hypothetical protein
MPKVEEKQYVCLCGYKAFSIFTGYVECDQCGASFSYYSGFLLIPRDFNGRRESLRRKISER